MKTRAELTTEIATQLASGQPITAAQLRQVMDDFNASEHNTLTDGTPVIVNGALGTPSSGVATNLTGTAAGLTAGNVTTNANLTGDVTSVGNATTLTNAPVIAKVLTGYVSGAGTVAATDSILQAIQKLNGNDATNANLTGDVTSVGNATTLVAGSAGSLNSGTLLAARMPALTGDITTSSGAVATTLATVNSNVGTFGSATKASVVTVNGKGLVTAASESTVTPAVGSITGLGTGVGTALAVNVGTAGAPVVNGGALGTPSSGVATNLTGTAAGLTAGNVTTNANLTGDVTSSGNAATVVKINGTSMAGLATGILKNTTSTGVPSIATAGTDYGRPITQGTLSGTTPAITFTDNEQELDWTITGNSTPTASGYAAARKVQIFITGDTSTRTFTWPSWTWIGGSPASSTANKSMRISLECRGSTAASVFATYAEQS